MHDVESWYFLDLLETKKKNVFEKANDYNNKKCVSTSTIFFKELDLDNTKLINTIFR